MTTSTSTTSETFPPPPDADRPRRSAGGGALVIVAASLVIVAAVSLAAGIGLGGPHLAKGGPILTTAFGLLLLVGGLAGVVTGVVLVARPLRWWGGAATAAAALVVTIVVILVVAPAVAATHVPPTDLGAETPADRGLAYDDVTFPAADGVTLAGWWIPSGNGAAVAVLHGAGSTRSNALDQAAVLADAGYGVLLYDARGHGESEGRAMDFGWYGDADVAGAVSFLAAQPDVDRDRIGLVGLSMGGEQAIGAAGSDERIRAVVAEGATGRVAADDAWFSEVYGWRGALQEGIDRARTALTELLAPVGRPGSLRDAAADADIPMLLIAAGEVTDEPHAAAYIQEGAPERVEVWEVPGAGHTDGLDTLPDEWESRVTGFLDDALPSRE